MALLAKRYEKISLVIATEVEYLKRGAARMEDALQNLADLQKDISDALERLNTTDIPEEEFTDASAFEDIDTESLRYQISSLVDELEDFRTTLSSIQFEVL